MEKKFILKLIIQCFQQYEDEAQSAVMNQEDMEKLSKQGPSKTDGPRYEFPFLWIVLMISLIDLHFQWKKAKTDQQDRTEYKKTGRPL